MVMHLNIYNSNTKPKNGEDDKEEKIVDSLCNEIAKRNIKPKLASKYIYI